MCITSPAARADSAAFETSGMFLSAAPARYTAALLLMIVYLFSAPAALGQIHWQVVGAEGRIQGTAFADEIPITILPTPFGVTEVCDLVGPGNTPLPFLPSVWGGSDGITHEYGRKCYHEARDESLNPAVWAQAVIKARAFIDGDNTNEVTIEWMNLTYCDQSADDYQSDATMSQDFTIDLEIVDPAAPVGTPVLVYYYWSAFGGANTHHDCPDNLPFLPCNCGVNQNDDPVQTINTFDVDGREVLGGRFDFASPGGLPGYNQKKNQGGALSRTVGDVITIKLNSFCDSHILCPPPTQFQAGPDATATFKGTLRITVGHVPQPPDPAAVPRSEFSVDIGSDTELSDPNFDGDEAFDPGDLYEWGGAPLPVCGTNGVRDDVDIFAGADLAPTPPDCPPALSAAPVCTGLWSPPSWFDLDGTDALDFSLAGLPGPIVGRISYFPSDCTYSAAHLAVSFDDDGATHYAGDQPAGANCSVPVNSGSPFNGDIYGTTARRDEVIYIQADIDDTTPTAAPVFSLPIADEQTVHVSMSPNPDNFMDVFDDDVDALDAVEDAAVCTVWYVSADHEALGFDPNNGIQLDPGIIYEVVAGGSPVPVVDPTINLGLSLGVDINAFEFIWLHDGVPPPANGVFLALLFSVDADDPLTPMDESGGLDPRRIYASFLDGISFEFLNVPLSENIDALMTWKTDLLPPPIDGACCDPLGGCTVTDPNLCAVMGGIYRGDGTDCSDLNLDGVPDVCECPGCRGDMTGDQKIDGRDIQAFITCLTGGVVAGVHCPCADIDADAAYTIGDLNLFVYALLNGPIGPCP